MPILKSFKCSVCCLFFENRSYFEEKASGTSAVTAVTYRPLHGAYVPRELREMVLYQTMYFGNPSSCEVWTEILSCVLTFRDITNLHISNVLSSVFGHSTGLPPSLIRTEILSGVSIFQDITNLYISNSLSCILGQSFGDYHEVGNARRVLACLWWLEQ